MIVSITHTNGLVDLVSICIYLPCYLSTTCLKEMKRHLVSPRGKR